MRKLVVVDICSLDAPIARGLLATFGLSGVIFPPWITGRQCNACRKTVAP
jgi:hypothetical protein